MFFTDQICVSIYCRRSPCDHFCQIILNSDQWFQSRRIKNKIPLLRYAMFLTDQIRFRLFIKGHLVAISAKSFSILTTCFREEDV